MPALTPERWQQIDTLFAQALDRPPDERTAFLRHACGNDPALYHEVVALLESTDLAEQALGDSATDFAAPLLSDLEARWHTSPEAPTRLGPYRLVGELGRGGMGTVYLAERADGQFERQVALKLVKRGMDTDEILRRFRHERQILASLQHPHIARLYDGGASEDGRPYLVMEHVAGTPIDRYCDARTLSVDQRLRLFESVCEAVQYAHQNLVVHRDLKPSNILVRDDGRVKLLDFGIAKLLSDEDDGLTRTGVRVMTPQYAAPEQAAGGAVTTATDVYALGVVLYELLTGHRPHESTPSLATEAGPERPSTAVTRATEHRQRDGATETLTPEAVGAARASTPDRLQRRLRGDLDTILLKALRPEAARRYASAAAFLDDIKRHLAGLPVAAQPDTVGYRFRTFVRRHRFGVATAAAFAVLLVAFVSFYTLRVTEERNVALQERAKAEEVVAFLEALFDASDPFAPERLDTMQVRTFLQRGAGMVQERLTGQPLVQAQMLTVLGRVYNRLGLRDEATPFLLDALDIRTRLLLPTDPNVAETLIELADIAHEQGDYARAESLSSEGLRIRRAVYGPRHLEVAEALHHRALALEQLGHRDEAEALHREVLAMKSELLGDQDLEVAITLNTLASVLIDQGDYAEAEALYRESLATRRAVYPAGHPSIAIGLNNLAVLLRNLARYDEAEPLVREALEINRAALGPQHANVLENLGVLATVLRGQGNFAAAEAVFEEVLALKRQQLGPNHPNVSITLDSYAALMKAKGDYVRAEALEREALAVARTAFGDEHFSIVITTGKLAGIIQAGGDARRALPLFQEALALAERLFPADHLQVVTLRSGLGQCLTKLSRYEEAEPLVLESYEHLAATQGAENRFTKSTLRNVIELYETWEKPGEAARYRALLPEKDDA